MRTKTTVDASSFRDPSGFVYYRDGSIYRQVNIGYKEYYDRLMHSGLYQTLVDSGLLIPHDEVDVGYAISDEAYKTIKPEPIPFISYPSEWSFSQLKDAALVTLEIEKKSLAVDMSLKDCSAYNIQFRRGKPIFIDTLSFEKYQVGEPWTAYRQFCQHFLAPLALMSYVDIRLSQLFRVYIDGVPLDLASSLLPFRSWLRFPLLSHIHFHAKAQRRFSGKPVSKRQYKISRVARLGLVENLESAIRKLKWQPDDTEWGDYYTDTNYSSDALRHKVQLVAEFLDRISPTPQSVWDLGANTGLFSRIAADKGIQTISYDIDPAAVEKNYLECVNQAGTNILPLLLDLTNPSPNLGWANQERMSFAERGPADVVFALALIHHLAISNNLPLNKIAGHFGQICQWLIIEFVPKSDSQLQRLLASREDIFPKYTQQDFETEFGRYFTIHSRVKINNTERTLFLMETR